MCVRAPWARQKRMLLGPLPLVVARRKKMKARRHSICWRPSSRLPHRRPSSWLWCRRATWLRAASARRLPRLYASASTLAVYASSRSSSDVINSEMSALHNAAMAQIRGRGEKCRAKPNNRHTSRLALESSCGEMSLSEQFHRRQQLLQQ